MVTLITVSVVIVVDHFQLALFREVAGDWRGYPRLGALAMLGFGVPILVVVGIATALFGPTRAFASLGLDRSVLTGFTVGLIGTFVLLLGYTATATATAPFAPAADPLYDAIRLAVLSGIGEEIIFRAFLFGFLFRFAGWGFLPAAFVGAAVFGASHLYQGENLLDSAGVFAITAIGAIWFA